MRALLQIRQAAEDGTWRAAAWRLERTKPELYGRTDRFAQAAHEARMAEKVTNIAARAGEEIALVCEEGLAALVSVGVEISDKQRDAYADAVEAGITRRG